MCNSQYSECHLNDNQLTNNLVNQFTGFNYFKKELTDKIENLGKTLLLKMNNSEDENNHHRRKIKI